MRLYDAQQAALSKGAEQTAAAADAALEDMHGAVSSEGIDWRHARECQQRAIILGTQVQLLEKQGTLVAAIKAAATRAFTGSAYTALQHGEGLPQQIFAGAALDEDSDEESEGEEE